MKNKHITIFLLTAFLLAWVFNYKKYNKNQSEKAKEDIEVIHDGFKGAVIELFDSAVDAQQAADCATKKIYQVIKSDPAQLEFFRKNGLKTLRPSLNDSIQLLFVSCIQRNVVDSNYTITLIGNKRKIFKTQLKNRLKETALETNTNLDTLCNCVLSKIAGMTIKEYFEDDRLKSIRFSVVVRSCLNEQK